jgi:catechol 2,3-dioxygenase
MRLTPSSWWVCVATESAAADGARLPAETRIGRVKLRVADLERSLNFYSSALGFETHDRRPGGASLGPSGAELLELVEVPGAPTKPEWATGLYHYAVLLPSRADLGRMLRHLIDTRTPLQGASDHLVSEALYLADPDENGIEIYRDRPRAEWPMQGDRVRMATDPLDADGILAEAGREGRSFAGLPSGTTIGHIHLQVGDIPAAEQFYVQRVGFDVVAAMPSALFVSAGGYHHHVGMNVWTSRGQGPVAGMAGLEEFEIVFPDAASRDDAVQRIETGHAVVDTVAGDTRLRDPWENAIRLVIAS